MNNSIIFISGVCGVGKTSLIPFLKNMLDAKKYDIHDFDERGVPKGADGEWRRQESRYWMALGKENGTKNKTTIVCGFSRPSELLALPDSDKIKIILLDITSEMLKERLQGRYQTQESIAHLEAVAGDSVEKFIEDNINFAPTLRDECEKYQCPTIDTSALTIEEVAQKVMALIEN